MIEAETTETTETATQQPLPNGWRWVGLSELVIEAQPGFASGERDPHGTIQLRMNNVTTRGTFAWNEFIRVPASDQTVAKYSLKPGDVLFNNTNSTELVGKSAHFDGHLEPVVYSNHFTRLSTNPNLLEPQYLSYWLQLQWKLRVFEELCNRWIGQSAVKNDKLLALSIPLPPLPEQRRIATLLREQMAAVEQARAAAQAQLQAARALPAAYLREVFESDEAQRWPIARLGDAGEIVSGITLGRKVADRETRTVPYLRVANVKDSYLDLSEVYTIEATEAEIRKCRLRYGDLLLTEGGDPDKLGRGTFWRSELPECIHQNHIFRVRLDATRFMPEFISAQLSSTYGKAYFLAHAKQTTGIATINQKVLAMFPVLAPPMDVQRDVVGTLGAQMNHAQSFLACIAQQLEAINALPQALLRRAFSGKL